MVLVKRYYEMAEDPAAPVAVPLRVKGTNGHPLLVTKTFQRGGQVTVVATTADMAYSDLCISPAFLVLCQELHKHTTKTHSIAPYNLTTTATLKLELDPAEYRRDVFARALSGQGFEGTFTAVDNDAAGKAEDGKAEDGKAEDGKVEDGKVVSVLTVPMSELTGLGLFELTLSPHRGEAERRLLSRRVPPAEGRLQRLDKTQWLRVYPEDVHDRLEVIEESGADTTVASVGEGEIWRLLAIALLTFLLLETVLAWRFGRR
jgi:hypothetical protein